ncbi:MAG: NAD(P)/FAD-dependent oxidoreductase [Anaerolineales bacterium]|nr:NAD(P)/FAD-dependent oxidoreductase [Anaerolineales bacterium]
MQSEVIVVGGGIAGLTAAAYLTRAGIDTLLLEKEPQCGGLINSFERDGFVYDGGIRALENAGVLFPMLKQLGLELEFVRNQVTLGLEDQVIRIESPQDIRDYQELLTRFYPENAAEIAAIIVEIKRIMQYMDIQYDIDNPAFLDPISDRNYFIRKVVPWMFKYALTFRKIEALNHPVVDYLKQYTHNQSLLDIICQHFFMQTPASFALSYLTLYLDYHYPKGGTGILTKAMVDLIRQQGGQIKNNARVAAVNPAQKTLMDTDSNQYCYDQLIWAADLGALYQFIDPETLPNQKERAAVRMRKFEIDGKKGNDSVFTLYLAVDLDPGYFGAIASEHFFYTPCRMGETEAGPVPNSADKAVIETWLEKFFKLTTYEIAIPVLRDKQLAPSGKTGLIISVLFDYHLTKQIEERGWYPEFKSFAEGMVIQILNETIYPGLEKAIIHQFSASPLTMERYTANRHGAITGWSFTNDPVPAEFRLPKIFSATETPMKGISQAGQWTYSPSGLPISILTGKLAADRVIKGLKNSRAP